MAPRLLQLLVQAVLLRQTSAAVIDITSFGARSDDQAAYQANTAAINAALAAARDGDEVLMPFPGTFYALGGITGSNLDGVTLKIDGTLVAVPEFALWPTKQPGTKDYHHFIEISNSSRFTLTSSDPSAAGKARGVVDGQGVGWWERYTIGECGFNLLHNKTAFCPSRPKLVAFSACDHLLVENVHLQNSPSFNLLLGPVRYAEVSHITIDTDVIAIRGLKHHLRQRKLTALGRAALPPHGLQPEDLNTDGIDPSGHDIWIHDCTIRNDDDSIAVKPIDSSNPYGPCSQNMLIENMVISGMGTSIGSVPPHPNHNCIKNITFRNITMPKTGKGVYIKSNPSCGPGKTAEITDIVYENITMYRPEWWAVWIGPQQQQEPGSSLGDKCALDYPIKDHCPTQGCVTFSGITLKDIVVIEPWLAPGVILGNASNPIRGLVMDNVVFHFSESDKRTALTGADGVGFPLGKDYQCNHTQLVVKGGTSPAPKCTA